jgi:hypothetical protein
LWSFNSSTGTFTKSLATGSGLVWVVFPFNVVTFLTQILSAVSTCSTVTGESLIWLLQIIHLNISRKDNWAWSTEILWPLHPCDKIHTVECIYVHDLSLSHLYPLPFTWRIINENFASKDSFLVQFFSQLYT